MGVKPEIEFCLGLGYQLPTTKRQPPPPISAPISMGRWDSWIETFHPWIDWNRRNPEPPWLGGFWPLYILVFRWGSGLQRNIDFGILMELQICLYPPEVWPQLALEKLFSQRERIVFQSSFFRGELLNFGGVAIFLLPFLNHLKRSTFHTFGPSFSSEVQNTPNPRIQTESWLFWSHP